ncbi:hypothetical protein F511_27310 [Dorcoceras hygrometricum]|uniref:Uncharacterized protein n=1 Tax=Dorcoceras hygrometricum TaxID=472368 RepID=A0A2Z7CGM6_9LAMI|nr:hypothetical protein F511_27310 [Dorcoceras hygrometricum]
MPHLRLGTAAWAVRRRLHACSTSAARCACPCAQRVCTGGAATCATSSCRWGGGCAHAARTRAARCAQRVCTGGRPPTRPVRAGGAGVCAQPCMHRRARRARTVTGRRAQRPQHHARGMRAHISGSPPQFACGVRNGRVAACGGGAATSMIGFQFLRWNALESQQIFREQNLLARTIAAKCDGSGGGGKRERRRGGEFAE